MEYYNKIVIAILLYLPLQWYRVYTIDYIIEYILYLPLLPPPFSLYLHYSTAVLLSRVYMVYNIYVPVFFQYSYRYIYIIIIIYTDANER